MTKRLSYGNSTDHAAICATIDIAAPAAGGWQLIAVRDATRMNHHHLAAVATQHWVAEGAGLPVTQATVRHLDPDFILPADGDLSDALTDSDVTTANMIIAAGRAALLARA